MNHMVPFTIRDVDTNVDYIPYPDAVAAIEELPPKRKKFAVSELSQSLGITAVTIEEHDGQNTTRSKLSTAMRSGKRMKSASALKGNANFKPPFQNTQIRKPSSARGMGAEQDLASQSPIFYHGFTTTDQGFTTTEEAVSLSKTTLERLSALRYRPSKATAVPLDPVPVSSRKETNVLPLLPNKQAYEMPSSDDDNNRNSNAFFRQAIWHTGDDVTCQMSDEVDYDPLIMPRDENAPSYGARSLSQDSRTLSKGSPDAFKLHENSCASQVMDGVAYPRHIARHLRSKNGFGNPTSSEAMLLDNIFNDVDADVNIDHPEAPFIDKNNILGGLRLHQLEAGTDDGTHSTGHDSMFQDTSPREVIDMNLGSDRRSKSEQPRKHAPYGKTYDIPLPRKENLNSSKSMTDPDCQIEIARSDYDNQPPPIISKDFYASDDFDEGLDDEDLLAVNLDVVAPQIRPNDYQGHIVKSQVPSSLAQVERLSSVNDANDVANRVSSSQVSRPNSRISCSDPDDEFPMDDEDEMLNFPGLYHTVVERFMPPTSVQECISTVNDSVTEEYDKRLLFSPATSPAKAVLGDKNDSNRASESPGGQLENSSSLVLEEEDWSFMRANNDIQDCTAQLALDCSTEPPSARPKRRVIDATSSSVKRTVSFVSRARTCATEATAASACSILELDDMHEYEPITTPFVRPPFADLVPDRSPLMYVHIRRQISP